MNGTKISKRMSKSTIKILKNKPQNKIKNQKTKLKETKERMSLERTNFTKCYLSLEINEFIMTQRLKNVCNHM